jgi:perosamine synthetase
MYFWEAIRPLDPFPDDYRERMSNVQAAIALEGLAKVDEWNAVRRRHANYMSEALADLDGVRIPVTPPDRTHVFYQYCAYVPSRDLVVDQCLRRGVDLETLHVDLCADLPLFDSSRTPAPGARQTTATVQVPVYESLTDMHLERVARVIRDAVASVQPHASAAVGARS